MVDLNVALIRKLSKPVVCLAYFFCRIIKGRLNNRALSDVRSGRMVQKLNVCSVLVSVIFHLRKHITFRKSHRHILRTFNHDNPEDNV